jgi:glutathione S-transferase
MKLIASLTSPFVRKVRIVLAEKKIDHEMVLEDVWAANTSIQQSNPLGKVPCLIMEDGGAVFDSRVIVEYLDNLSPLHKLIAANGRARTEAKCWEALADGVADAGILVRLELTQRPAAQQSQVWIDRQMGKVFAGIQSMSQALGEKAWAVDNKYGLADIAMGSALGWVSFRMPEINWRSDYPNLAAHFDKLSARQSFIDTEPR